MRKMKDSGIPWIGEMPESWNLRRMKNCILSRTSGAWGEEAKGADGDVICLRIADFDYDRFVFKNTPVEDLTIRNYDNEIIKKLLLQKGDILIEKSGGGEKTPVGRTVVFEKDYPALYANFMDRLRCACSVLSKWMQYVFVTFYKNDYTRNYIKQTTGIQNLDLTSMLANERVPIPSIDEQEKITGFLDTECARIDAVMEQTQASIEEYKKLKQSIITEAVTKGIRPNRPMKDSGIDWIGQIPADWRVLRKLSYACAKSISYGIVKLFDPDDEHGVKVLRCSDVREGMIDTSNIRTVTQEISQEYSRTILNGGEVVINVRGTLGGCAIVPAKMQGYNIAREVAMVAVNNTLLNYYLMYYFLSSAFQVYEERHLAGSVYIGLNIEMLSACPIPFPSIDEQREIVNYLNQKCIIISEIICQKEKFLSEMESYKKSLIFEYVTGKKEVCTL